MVHHLSTLALEDGLREKLQGYDTDFPYTAISTEPDRYDGRCVSWHWHEQFEYSMVVRGTLEMRTRRNTYTLREGDGLFVNSNALHTLRSIEDVRGSVLHAHIFDRSLIAATNCVLRRYVGPVAACASMEALFFSRDDERQRRVSERMEKVFHAAEDEKDGFELEISSLLSEVWLDIYVRARGVMDAEGLASQAQSSRIKDMLSYIHAHYAEDITPRMIADHAGVCERECFRCFKRELGMTPLDCLNDHRLNVASRMLTETELSVTEIAGACGFSTPSYFGRLFRGKMLCTPREYRKRA